MSINTNYNNRAQSVSSTQQNNETSFQNQNNTYQNSDIGTQIDPSLLEGGGLEQLIAEIVKDLLSRLISSGELPQAGGLETGGAEGLGATTEGDVGIDGETIEGESAESSEDSGSSDTLAESRWEASKSFWKGAWDSVSDSFDRKKDFRSDRWEDVKDIF